MRRAYLSVLLALVLPAFSVSAQGTRGGGTRGPEGGGGHGASVSYHGSYGHGGGAFRPGFGGRGGFTHGGGFHGGYHGVYGRGYGRGYYYRHGHSVLVAGYGYGFPNYYPYFASPYYCAPTSGYDTTQPVATYAAQPDYSSNPPPDSSVDNSSPTDTYTAQDAQGYYQVGDQWGTELKQYQLTMDQLVTYLKAYIVNASPAQQSAFRSGFIASPIPNAEATFDQAMERAAPQS